jgi:hypothetical protein
MGTLAHHGGVGLVSDETKEILIGCLFILLVALGTILYQRL